jgi:hypothetical protein
MLRRRRLAAYSELQQRLDRHAKLARTVSHLAQQKAVAGKGRKRRLSKQEQQQAAPEHPQPGREGAGVAAGGADGRGRRQAGKQFKWKQERKR